jgi:DNA-binding NarL/FixJ family response regulator
LPNPKPIRIVLVGRHRVVLDSLGGFIASEPDFDVLGEAAQADIALFDLEDAEDDRLFKQLAKTARASRTIVLSFAVDPMVAFRVFQAGALGLVSKRNPPEMLLKAIRKVHAGEAWIGRTMAAQVVEVARSSRRDDSRIRPQSDVLSARERELIALVGEGWRNADIARHLVASEATIRASLTSIFRKLRLPGRFALMIYASQHGYASAGLRPRDVPAS